jgi:hypothetical protein
MDTVTGQFANEESEQMTVGEEGPKTTASGPIPSYIPLASGLLEESIEIII